MNSHMDHDPQDEFAPRPEARKIRNRAWRPGMGLVIIGILCVLVISLVAMRVTETSSADRRLHTATVRRDNLTVTVTESGTLAARKSIMYKCQMYNNPAIINIVPEGTYVTSEDVNNGRVLVELDPSATQERLASQQGDLLQVQAEITQAKEDYDIQLTQNESDITAAKLAVEFAWMDFERYVGTNLSGRIKQRLENDPNAVFDPGSWLSDPNELGGAAEQTYSTLNDTMTMAQARLKRAQDVLESTRKLYDVNYVSLMKLEGDELEVNSNGIQCQQAQAALELFKTYDFSKQAKRLLSSYQEALRELTRTFSKTRAREVQARTHVESRESRLKMVQAEVKRLEGQIEASKIRATAPGLLIHQTELDAFGNYRVMINEGARIRYNQKVVSLPDISEMMAKVGLPESSVDKVRVGQKATIIIDAFLDRTFYGEVLRVASLPEKDSVRGSNTKVYTAEISIGGSYDFLKPGMSAKVEIVVKHLKDVLVVPIRAVANRTHKKECFVSGRGGPVPREVVTGAFNKSSVQIIDGLTEGEVVLLNPPWRYEENKEVLSDRTNDPPTDEQEPPKVGLHPPEGTHLRGVTADIVLVRWIRREIV